jgi:two-component system, NarL family, sensor histidine kinase DegS
MGSVTRDEQATAVDALYAEVTSVLARSAEDIRGLTGRLREGASSASAETVPAASRAADAAARLERLSLALDEVRWSLQHASDASGGPVAGAADGDPGRPLLEAQEEERARLAEELHDGPAQVLSNAVLRVRVVERAMRSDTAAAMVELEGLRHDLERQTERLRDYIRQLRTTLLEPGDLASEITETADQLRKDAGITVDVDLAAPETELDAPSRTAVLRVALEALRNVRKHAHARTVHVRTRTEPPDGPGQSGWWILEVQDDGEGFAVDDASEHGGRRHFGLRFMRERAQHVGGELDIVSEAAAGTTVRLRLHPRERGRTTW